MYSWRSIFEAIKKERTPLLFAQLLAILATVTAVPTPLLMPLLVDEVLLHKPGWVTRTIDHLFAHPTPFVYVMVVLIAVLFLRFSYIFLNIWQSKIFQTIAKKITFDMRKKVLQHLQRVSLAQYEMLGSGAVASRLITDVQTLDTFLSASISKLLVSLLTLLGVCVVLLVIHWQLALFIIFLNPLVVLFSVKLSRKVARLKKEENRAIEAFQQAIVETLELFEQIRAANKERFFFSKLLLRVKEVKDRSIEFSWKSDAAARLSFLVFVSGFELFRAAGILAVAYSDLSIGLMLAIFGYLWFMMTPIQDIITIQYAFKNADIALQRINDLLQLQPEPIYPHLQNPFKEAKPIQIDLEHITFSYDGVKEVLKDVTMHIPAGKRSAIVGASGSGKTTLSRLLVGFYPPQKGDILYNGVSIRHIGLDVVREHVALVLQTPVLFNDTILFNVTLGKKIEEKKIWEALEMAQIADAVREMPKGLYTLVGKGGMKLSGGQRQRIAIARMIVQDPKVVILDESTSAIDVETEKRLFASIKSFLDRRTTIIIAHRASTIAEADFIFLLKEGKVEKAMPFDAYKENFV